MKSKSLTSLLLLGLILPALTFANPSADTVKAVQKHIEALKENPESDAHLDSLMEEIESVTQTHGVKGAAWLAYKEPVLLEAFISPQSFGLENISVSLLEQATSKEELAEMIYALVLAQLYMELDPQREEHIEYLKEGASLSSVDLNDVELGQLVDQAVVAGVERGTAEVQAAHSEDSAAIRALIRVRMRLIAKGKDFLIPIIDRIISKLRAHRPEGHGPGN